MAAVDSGWDEKLTEGIVPTPVVSGWRLWPMVLLVFLFTVVLVSAMYRWPIIVPVVIGVWFCFLFFILVMLLLARKRIMLDHVEIQILRRAIRGGE